MSFTRAVIRTAISIVVLGIALAVQANAQAGSAEPNGPLGTQTGPAAKPASKKEKEDLRKQIQELRLGQEQLRKEILELKQMIQALQSAARSGPPEKISIAQRPSRGNELAHVVVVEFSDYQCPYCALFFRQTLPQLDQDYIRTGKIKYVFNNVPLDQIHPAAFKAAEAAECARDQGKFWEMHDKIFANQKTLSLGDLNLHASAIGLELTQFSQCLSSGKNTAVVKAGLAQAAEVGVDGTPTFVIALADARNPRETNLKVVAIISGAQPFAVFKSTLDKALASP